MSFTGLTIKRWWRRQRNLYCRRYQKSSLLTVALIIGQFLGAFYLIYKYGVATSPRYTDYFVDPHHLNLPARKRMNDADISKHKSSLMDRRYEHCIQKTYPEQIKQVKVSFLMYYKDKDFNLLKLALSTLVQFTPRSALYEVIIIDDNTVETDVKNDAKLFFAKNEFHGINIKTYRTKVHSNYAVSWAKAARRATGDILIFIDSDVIFNTGWYEPIVEFLIRRPETIAVPRSEAMLAEARYIGFVDNYVNVFSWRLSILHYNAKYENDTDTFPTPVFRGDLFAMHKKFYDSLGGLDEVFTSGEGAELELSLRTWLCGGEIHVVKCSQIAVHNVLTPREIKLPITLDRITNLWFDHHSTLVYKQANQPFMLTEDDKKSLAIRKTDIERLRGQTCKDFNWYLSNVASMIKVPRSDMNEFGKIRDSTGYCLKISSDGKSVAAVLCNPPLYQPDMIFEYTSAKHLTLSDKCLASETETTLTFAYCGSEADLAQQWEFGNDGLIRNKLFGSCIEHVNIYESSRESMSRQARLKPCDDTINTQKWSFISY